MWSSTGFKNKCFKELHSQYANQSACNLSEQFGIKPQPVKNQGTENFFTLSERGSSLIFDLSLVPKPEHEEGCQPATCPDGSKRTPTFTFLLICQVVKLVIAFILHFNLGDSDLFMSVILLALSLEIDVFEGQVILARAIKEVFRSVSGLLAIKMVR